MTVTVIMTMIMIMIEDVNDNVHCKEKGIL